MRKEEQDLMAMHDRLESLNKKILEDEGIRQVEEKRWVARGPVYHPILAACEFAEVMNNEHMTDEEFDEAGEILMRILDFQEKLLGMEEIR